MSFIARIAKDHKNKQIDDFIVGPTKKTCRNEESTVGRRRLKYFKRQVCLDHRKVLWTKIQQELDEFKTTEDFWAVTPKPACTVSHRQRQDHRVQEQDRGDAHHGRDGVLPRARGAPGVPRQEPHWLLHAQISLPGMALQVN